jgi:hypothetical protein
VTPILRARSVSASPPERGAALRAVRFGGDRRGGAEARGGILALLSFSFSFAIAFVFVALAALAGCRGKATREDCAKMMDRYVDLAIAEEPALAKLTPSELATAREMKRELKLGVKSYKKVHDRCEREITRAEVSCALGAGSSKEWETCIE